MDSWIERKTRKLVIAGALAFAIGAPTIACMGGGTEGGGEEGGGTEASAKLVGTWKVKPHPDDMRPLKIVAVALKPNSTVANLEKQLQPPPTAEEKAMFEDVKRRGKNDPEVAFLASMIEMMKGATLAVDDANWVYTFNGETLTMPYTIDAHDGATMEVTLTGSPAGTEKWTLNFKGDNEIDLQNTVPTDQRLVFVRK